MEFLHSMSVGHGTASPSLAGVFDENPAGVGFFERPSLVIESSSDSSFSNINGGGGFVYAKKGFGAGIEGSLTHSSGSTVNYSSTALSTVFGLHSREMGIGFGVRCGLGTIGTLSLSCNRMGAIYDNLEGLKLGAEVGLGSSITVSVGAAYQLSRDALLAFDVIPPISGQSFILSPGFAILGNHLQLMAGYGLIVSNSQSYTSSVYSGPKFGIGAKLGLSLSLQAYYNYSNTYSMGMVIRF